jgi:hypothetical protein
VKLKQSKYRLVLEHNMPETPLWQVSEVTESDSWLGALVWVRRAVRGLDPRDVEAMRDLRGPVTGSVASGKLDPFNLPPDVEVRAPGPCESRDLVVRAPDGAMEAKRGVLVYDYLDVVEQPFERRALVEFERPGRVKRR